MKKGGGSVSTIIVGPSKSVLVYALHSLEYVLGLARFRVFVPKLYYLYSMSIIKLEVLLYNVYESAFALHDDNRKENAQTVNHKCVAVHFANKQTVFH